MAEIVLFGNGKGAIQAHEYLESQRHKVLAVPNPEDDGKNSWRLSFKKYCTDNQKDFLSPTSFKDQNFIKELAEFEADLMLSLQGSQIISEEVINMVDGEIFNFHFADLPKNRGCYPVYWHIRNGDTYAGVTLHKLIKAVDAGNMIAKRRKRIEISDSTRSVFEWCEDNAVIILRENLDALLNRTYQEIPQDEPLVSYYSRHSVDFGFPYIDWHQKTSVVSRHIQAFVFPPFQYPKSRYRGRDLEIQRVLELGDLQHQTQPGTILTANAEESFYEVQTNNGSIWLEIRTPSPLKSGQLLYL